MTGWKMKDQVDTINQNIESASFFSTANFGAQPCFAVMPGKDQQGDTKPEPKFKSNYELQATFSGHEKGISSVRFCPSAAFPTLLASACKFSPFS